MKTNKTISLSLEGKECIYKDAITYYNEHLNEGPSNREVITIVNHFIKECKLLDVNPQSWDEIVNTIDNETMTETANGWFIN